eukprot:7046439-Ditylum_brightwellii.AAC.2
MKELLAKGKKLSNEEGKDYLDKVEDGDKDISIKGANFEGLGTGLRPVERMKHAPKGLEDLKLATKDYIKWVEEQLEKIDKVVPRCYITVLHKDEEDFLKQIKFLISKKEKEFIKEALFLKVIPQPQLLVKDHKDPDEKGNFPTRLVIPATNFTASFSKSGYIGIKKVLIEHGVNYSKHTIVQSSGQKGKLEKCKLK